MAAIALVTGLAVVEHAAPAAAVTAPSPAPLRTVGSSGHAELYGWGATTMLDGSVLIGDYWNFRVRHFAMDGSLTGDFVNNPGFEPGQHQAPYGLAVDPVTGDVYMADTDRYQINKYRADGTYLLSFGTQGSGPSQFLYPSRVAVASDRSVYVVDTWANKIKAFTPEGAPLRSFGTTGTADGAFKQPHGAAFDQYDRLWVADTRNWRIQVFDKLGNFLFKTGSKGFMDGQFMGDMRGLAIDKANSWVYQVDAEGNRVDKFSYDATTSATNPPGFVLRWGTEGTDPGQFIDGGREITVDGLSNVWVGDMPNFRVQRFDSNGTVLSVYPNPPAPPPPGGFNHPRGVAGDSQGNIFVTDTYNQRMEKFAPDGSFLLAWGTRGRDGEESFNYPRQVAVDRRNDDVLVADTDNHRIKRYTNNGAFIWEVGGRGTGPGLFRNPHGLAVAPDGTIYVADSNNARIVVMAADGTYLTSWGVLGSADGQLRFPRGVAVDPADGTLWVSDGSRNVVQHFTASGTFLGRIGSGGLADDQFRGPWGVAVDASFVYVADPAANKVKVWNKAGAFVTTIGGPGRQLGKMYGPKALDIDRNGHLLVGEEIGERIQEFLLDTTAPSFGGLAAATAVSPTRVDLSWAPASDNMNAAAAIVYDVCVVAGTGGCVQPFVATATTAPGATSFSATGLTPSTAYSVAVRARDVAGNRDTNTVELQVTTQPAPDVTPPSFAGLASAANPDHTSVDLAWAPATDDMTPSSGIVYQVCWSTSAGACASAFVATATTVAGATSFRPTGLAPGVTYWFVVRAVDASGNVDTNTVEQSVATIPDTQAPAFAGITSAVAISRSSIVVSWAPASDDVTPPSGIVYDICRSTNPNTCLSNWKVTATTAPGATSFTVRALAASTTQYFIVRARDSVGNRDMNLVQLSATTLA